MDVTNADAPDEALARYAEGLAGWLEAAHDDPAKIMALAERDPGLVARILDSLQRALRSIAGARIEMPMRVGQVL